MNAVGELLPKARYQRCMVHFKRNILSKVSHRHTRWAAYALKAVSASETCEAALDKAESVPPGWRSANSRL